MKRSQVGLRILCEQRETIARELGFTYDSDSMLFVHNETDVKFTPELLRRFRFDSKEWKSILEEQIEYAKSIQ